MTEPVGEPGLDRIFIRDLLVRCIVGVDDQERAGKQDVLVHLTLYADLRTAGRSDVLADTIDYSALKRRIIGVAENARFHLIEALAQRIAEECLTDGRIERVTVAVEKPGALRFARTVGVEITRSRERSGKRQAQA
jgi:FolB domain-containing protein